MRDLSYAAVMARKNAIMKASMGMDYDTFALSPVAFDYERMMRETGYSLEDVARIQADTKVGNTPLFELTRLTEAVRRTAAPGKGATILVKDEAANASGSFKARRASISAYEARKKGYKGLAAATSGNYGAAVASQAAMRGLKCIILQEVFDSKGIGQPEIVEKSRACEAYGAEVQRLSVGPELFYQLLMTLEETGFFNASLYTPFGIKGVETLGVEIAQQVRARYRKDPDAVVITNAGGGNLT
ncbi:MAG TPA: PLP-dependent lyase/thiolase, partial [Holophaga sp.]|nr:PLP-dependent lyase/thiolase [Holophaga sp.]